MNSSIRKDDVGELIRSLEQAVRDRVAAEKTIDEQFSTGSDPHEAALALAVRERDASYHAEVQTLEDEHNAQLEQLRQRYESDRAELEAARTAERNRIENQAAGQIAEVRRKHEEAAWVAQSVLDENSEDSPQRQFERLRSQLDKSADQQQQALAALQETVNSELHARGWSREEPPPPSSAPGQLDALASAFTNSVTAAEQSAANLRKLRLPKLFEGMRPLWLSIVLFGAMAFPLYSFLDPDLLGLDVHPADGAWVGLVAGAALLISLLMVTILYTLSSMQVNDSLSRMHEESTAAAFFHEAWLTAAGSQRTRYQKEFEIRRQAMEKQLQDQLQRFEDKLQTTLEDVENRRQQKLNDVESSFRTQLTALEERFRNALETASREIAKRLADAEQQYENDRAELRVSHDSYISGRVRAREEAVQQMTANWDCALQFATVAERFADDAQSSGFLSWEALHTDTWEPPTQIPSGLRIGVHRVELQRLPGGIPSSHAMPSADRSFRFPAMLPVPEGASLLLKTNGQRSRRIAIEAMQTCLLRMLTQFPPGKVRLTIFDPVGLGESFSGLMHLADYDELLITNRIWTETAQLEARLAELTEHMENVLQKYLRNEFPSIEAYNEFAGEVAEPYHILVVTDFPQKISEQAARRLMSVATSGPRCGVYLMMSAELQQPVPHGFDLKVVEANATTLVWDTPTTVKENELQPYEAASAGPQRNEDEMATSEFVDEEGGQGPWEQLPHRMGDKAAFYLQTPDEAASRWPIDIDQPPSPEVFTRIVRMVGEAAKDVRRIEVSFSRIAPRPEDVWSNDSRRGIDLPLGRAGATKLQHLRLGRGTSQHMLVAGKTGSGKSTFFHALITNAALHYSPTELEFYLVDFKKGVEFKAYAGGRLPHARVIAIESDREFGVSVLQKLDRILHERGEVFRKHGVQDLAAFRDRVSNGQSIGLEACAMPRVMLVIDEFQEFFVEDDRLSQQAALLLDRLVRQGRAFGIHVILGSQTLGGAYSLARSTLGQVAVRVALQCSEADAHLILSESNTAARLLTRPGEAIYNDSNGAIEGNHPFQIAWLPDDERAGYLRALEQLAQEQGLRQEPPIVFEGNVPSDPARNPLLRQLFDLQTADAPSRVHTVWVGETVEIGPPTHIEFQRRAGMNLLLIGQDTSSAQGILATAAAALAAQIDPANLSNNQQFAPRLWIFDGSHAGTQETDFWKQIASIRPDASRIVTPGSLDGALDSLTSELQSREQCGSSEERPPLFVVISQLSRFRALRKGDDDFGFAGFGASQEDPPADPSKQFTELLRRGPEHGIHVLAWIESASNLDRWLSRQSLKEFELRVLFAMNAGDSSHLIESPAAAKLGPHRALLYREETGETRKFRPYGPPTTAWLQDVRRRLLPTQSLEAVQDLDGFRVV